MCLNKRLFLSGLGLIIFLLPSGWAASIDLYPFTQPEKRLVFQEITSQLRCLVCQNQSIADSNAPLANDLRQVVYEQVREGITKKDILIYMTQRYGHYVRYQPPLTLSTFLLWGSPFLLLGGLILCLRSSKLLVNIFSLISNN